MCKYQTPSQFKDNDQVGIQLAFTDNKTYTAIHFIKQDDYIIVYVVNAYNDFCTLFTFEKNEWPIADMLYNKIMNSAVLIEGNKCENCCNHCLDSEDGQCDSNID
jgi:hypothetical protein